MWPTKSGSSISDAFRWPLFVRFGWPTFDAASSYGNKAIPSLEAFRLALPQNRLAEPAFMDTLAGVQVALGRRWLNPGYTALRETNQNK